MAPGTLSLQNILQPHYKFTRLPQLNPGVSSILHHSGRAPSKALSRVSLPNLLNLVKLTHLIPLSQWFTHCVLGMSYVV